MTSKKIGENDKCEFYRTEHCKALEQEPKYTEKYGEGCRFILVRFKPGCEPDDKDTGDRYANEYIICDSSGEPVGKMIEHSTEWQDRQLQRVMGSLNNLPE